MRAKAYFQRVRLAERDLKLTRAKIRHFQDVAYSITGGSLDSPVVSHSLGPSRVETAAMGIYDATQALERQAEAFIAVIRDAERVIAQIPQAKYREVLTLRYLAGWTWKSISDELRYQDEKSVYKAHGWALTEAQKILDSGGKHEDRTD